MRTFAKAQPAAKPPVKKTVRPQKPPAAARDTADAAPEGGCKQSLDSYEAFDHATQAWIARFTLGLSPVAVMGAWLDWATHLAAAPGKRLQLVEKAVSKASQHTQYMLKCGLSANDAAPCIQPLPQDSRFRSAAWQARPFNLIYQSFLLQQQWWHNAVTGVPGVSAQHERELQFLTRQMLDLFSPSNFLLTNPEVFRRTRDEAGRNLLRGMQHLAEDMHLRLSGSNRAPDASRDFLPGRDVALTKGRVVYRNRLIELIQYAPLTSKTHARPILIVPAWIMKYYILDLSPQNSMVRYLVEQGHSVFMISWKNPDKNDCDLSLDDYRQLGIMQALDAIGRIIPEREVQAVGYCLGGTLLAIAAAAMARDGDTRLASLSLLASQVDFTEAGELKTFINESQLAFLDSIMWTQGYLDTTQMASAFQMLRSGDLLWSQMVQEYLMGEREPMFDILAWSTDATRMPYRMHSEYLRKLYLDNALAEGHFRVGGRPVHISDIKVPIFAVGTTEDHIAPWQSVFKINMLSETDVTFTLTSGGHNAGIVTPPEHPHRTYQTQHRTEGALHLDPETWLRETPLQQGSWWLSWAEWLAAQGGPQTATPPMGRITQGADSAAPGTYVFQR